MFYLVQYFIQGVGRALHLYPRHDTLVTAAAIEAVEALGGYAHHLDAAALRRGGEVADARVVAALVDEELDDGSRIGAQAGQHRMEAEHDSRLLLCVPAHRSTTFGGDEVHLARLDVDAHQLHAHAIGEAIALLGAVAEQHVARRVELEVVAAELGDVHQAVDEVLVERDEEAERGDAGDSAAEGLADVVAHVEALEPGLDV